MSITVVLVHASPFEHLGLHYITTLLTPTIEVVQIAPVPPKIKISPLPIPDFYAAAEPCSRLTRIDII